MIDLSKWKEFKVSDIFKKISVKKFPTTPEDEGKVPFISSTSLNNGVSTYSNECSYEGKCITVSTNGNCFDCFYHDGQIALSNDVEILVNQNLNESNALFICTILNKEQFKWNYGRKPKNDKVFDTTIRLPESNGKPDWKYMTEYINQIELRERESGKTIKDSLVTKNNHPLHFSIDLWKDFRLKDLFDEIYKGKSYVKTELQGTDSSGIAFISRTDNDNGCDGFIEGSIEDFKYEKGKAIIIGDTTSTCFYQENDFICGDHIVVMRAAWLNKYTGLFIKTLIEKERYKYSYGRAFKMELIKDTAVKLPVDKQGVPDWFSMESFIKALPYGDRI